MRITPYVQRVNYKPFPADHRNVVRTVVDLLQTNPIVVLSGKLQPFVQNRQIGKSLSCREILNQIAARGKTSYYLDLKHILKYQSRSGYLHIDDFEFTVVDNLSKMDAYILDEIHHAFPRDASARGKMDVNGKPVYRGEEYNRVMFKFWGKVKQRVADGAKFIFVTALHPGDAEYTDFLMDDNMLPFFNAPVVELQV